MPKVKYATEEERKAARKEQERRRAAERRLRAAQAEGREVRTRRTFKTEEERSQARQTQRKLDKRKARSKKSTPWEPRFVGIDGESFLTGNLLKNGEPEQAYCLLLRHDKEELYNPNGLSTWDCLDYLTSDVPRRTALVGYFLNFDFEWILKDISQQEYINLQAGKEVSLFADEYRVQWFVGKKLVVKRVYPSARSKEPHLRKARDFRMVTMQDTSGFFQSSFVSALKKWGFADDSRLDIITSGKAARGGFRHEDYEEVSKYNAMEMELLEELMLKVYESFKAAYNTAGLKFSVNSNSWSGPGVFANDFLKQTLWAEEHAFVIEDAAKKFSERYEHAFGNEAAKDYCFSLAYYGGRIELAGVGKFPGAFNYDINSAYPYALSLLPRWTPEDFELYEYLGMAYEQDCKEFLSKRLMGMYGVRFKFPEGWSWYPFPVRLVDGGSPNVFYPRQGTTNIMSPELFAVLDTLTEEELKYVSINYAYVLKGTEGHGDALTRMEANKLCLTATKTLEMADTRLQCKAAGKRVGKPEEQPNDKFMSMAEKALKLILNSLYGKTVQQVGSHKYYSDFASAWITSTCRALLWRAMAPERTTNNVIMTMTDGIYSRVKLPFPEARITSVLGDWEAEEFTYFETFKPGIYRYEDKDGMHYKVRGLLTPTEKDRELLFDMIWESVSRGTIGQFPSRSFITRNIAKIKWVREPFLRQFQTTTKAIEAELRAKRMKNYGTGWLIPDGERFVFFEPKGMFDLNDSVGYSLDFENYKTVAKTEEDVEDSLAYWDSLIGHEEYYDNAS